MLLLRSLYMVKAVVIGTSGVSHKDLVKIVRRFAEVDRVKVGTRYIEVVKWQDLQKFYLTDVYLGKLTVMVFTMQKNIFLKYLTIPAPLYDGKISIDGGVPPRIIELEALQEQGVTKVTQLSGITSQNPLPAPCPRWTQAVFEAQDIKEIPEDILSDGEKDFVRGIARPTALHLEDAIRNPKVLEAALDRSNWLTVNLGTRAEEFMEFVKTRRQP